jgi:hypothetical protein
MLRSDACIGVVLLGGKLVAMAGFKPATFGLYVLLRSPVESIFAYLKSNEGKKTSAISDNDTSDCTVILFKSKKF